MPDDPEPITMIPYTLRLPCITEQAWHDAISLLQQHIRQLERRLITLEEVANKAISDQLDEVEGRCHALWKVDAERGWQASTAISAEAERPRALES